MTIIRCGIILYETTFHLRHNKLEISYNYHHTAFDNEQNLYRRVNYQRPRQEIKLKRVICRYYKIEDRNMNIIRSKECG